MKIRGLVGAVYEDDTVPVTNNIALIFDWSLDAEYREECTFGPVWHEVLTSWHVKAEAYWAPETMPQGQYFVRLFIGKDEDRRCLAGQVEIPALQKTDGIYEVEINLRGIGPIRLEGLHEK